MAWFALKRALDIANCVGCILGLEFDRGAAVIDLRIIWQDGCGLVEEGEGVVDVSGGFRALCAFQQDIDGRAAGRVPDDPDALLDRRGVSGGGRGGELRE